MPKGDPALGRPDPLSCWWVLAHRFPHSLSAGRGFRGCRAGEWWRSGHRCHLTVQSDEVLQSPGILTTSVDERHENAQFSPHSRPRRESRLKASRATCLPQFLHGRGGHTTQVQRRGFRYDYMGTSIGKCADPRGLCDPSRCRRKHHAASVWRKPVVVNLLLKPGLFVPTGAAPERE